MSALKTEQSESVEEGHALPVTRWSLVLKATRENADPGARAALDELAEMYRGCVSAYVRARSHTEEQSSALASEFFETLRARKAFDSLDRGDRRFRVWLLSELKEFLAEKPRALPPISASLASAPQGSGVCSECGAPAPGEDADQPCPACLLRLAAERPGFDDERDYAETEAETPSRIGNYQIIELIGEGGMSRVYRARHRDSDHDVALKIMKAELTRFPELVERFRKGVELAARLEHPNIIRVYDRAGLSEKRPYYTMQLILGGTLADPQRRKRLRAARSAAKSMIGIARAVQFAHEHGILHRDLKPDNILLDVTDQPYVADFMATRIERRIGRAGRGSSSAIVGALGFMAPEQAAGEAVTTAADVYGLGAIFYDLLTDRPPFEAETLAELRERHKSERPKPPREVVEGLNRELDAICLAALDTDPERRSRSAGQFAESLACALRHEPPPWPPTPRQRRLTLWARRHPLLAVSAVIGTLLLLIADAAMFAGARAQREEVRDAALRSNAALASAQSRTLLAALDKYGERAALAASDPAIGALLARGRTLEPASELRELYESAGNLAPEAVYLLDREGVLVARWASVPRSFVGVSYAFRDYFKCAKDLPPKMVCISPAYRSEVHNLVQFAFSAPVRAADGTWLGVLVMSKDAARTLKDVDIDDLNGSGQITAVFAVRGAERTQPADKQKMIAVFHRALRGNDERALDGALAGRLMQEFKLRNDGGYLEPVDVRPLEDHDYRDPLSDPAERWLAALSPVGRTGYVVAVATPYERALGPTQRLTSLLSTYGGILNLSFLVIAAIAVWASLRTSKVPEAG